MHLTHLIVIFLQSSFLFLLYLDIFRYFKCRLILLGLLVYYSRTPSGI